MRRSIQEKDDSLTVRLNWEKMDKGREVEYLESNVLVDKEKEMDLICKMNDGERRRKLLVKKQRLVHCCGS